MTNSAPDNACPQCGYILGPFEVACPRCPRTSAAPTNAPPPNTFRCQFCHEWVPTRERVAHEKTHDGFRPDGQLTEYITLPPEARSQASLEGVPSVYIHPRCGGQTGMPEEIIRSYLQDPYLYSADRSYCSGCRTHIPCRELIWIETGENMQVYNDRLRAAHPEKRPPWYRWDLQRIAAALFAR